METRYVLSDLHPKSLKFTDKLLIHEYNNRQEFNFHLKEEGEYKNSVIDFRNKLKNGCAVPAKKIEKIRNTVRNNLIKRGIISGTVYEGFKYDVDGIIVDYAELASGNPECMLKPLKKYDKYFYELYINMSIPWKVSEDEIDEGAIRLIETIKCLEELNIEIKINLVMASRGMYTDGDSYLCIIPICSHLEFKDYNLLYPYCTGEFLRGPMFQQMKSTKPTVSDLGYAIKLDNSVNIWEVDEVALSERVLNDLDMKG